MNIQELVRNIQSPGIEFSPIPFWFFNDTFDEERIRKQLEDYVEKGVNGFVLHPRIGVPEDMPYLSETYFEAVRFIVKTASELEMKVVLYDEGMYPSGSAHGKVVEADPEFASKGIHLVAAEEAAEVRKKEQIIASLADGSVIAYGFTGGTIRGIHFGEDDGEAGAPKSADILNPNAVDEFIRLTHDAYYEHLKEYFGSTVVAFFTDEPCALGRNAGGYREWTPGLEKELTEAGADVREIVSLFEETEKENFTVCLYHRLIKEKLREIFYAKISVWCEKHGISLIGHPSGSDDIEEELYFHIPGQDLIMRRVSPETGGLREFDSVQAKLTADLARHLGRRRNANECFGVCNRESIPWYFTAEDMKWYIDWLGLRGVNLFIPHAFYYSVAGERKEERPPDVGPNNIWWPYYRRISDYIKRLSYLMTDSVNGARVAVLCDNNKVPYKEIACLYERQIEFNYLPVVLLENAEVCEKEIRLSGLSYTVVLNLLGEEIQERFAGRFGAFLRQNVQEILKAEKNFRDIELSEGNKDLRKIHLTKQGVEMYLFGNEGNDTINTQVTLPGKSELLFIDLWKGSCYRIEDVKESFTLHLKKRETLLVIPFGAQVADCGVQTRKTDSPNKEYPDWTNAFTMIDEKENRKVYVLRKEFTSVSGEECFLVRGTEMIECYCNDQFADVSLWEPHCFDVGTFLKPGANGVKLVVTGNAANIYEKAGIFFGLE